MGPPEWHVFPGNRESRFPLLSTVARLVLVIPHSNAGEERVFSLINKNKTSSRPSLALDGTLSLIIQVKMASQTIAQPLNHRRKCSPKPKKQPGNTIRGIYLSLE